MTIIIAYNEIHTPDEKWLFWLGKKLEDVGFTVHIKKNIGQMSSKEAKGIAATYDIPSENIFRISGRPGSLTLFRYIEYLAKHNRLSKSLLISDRPAASKVTSKEVQLFKQVSYGEVTSTEILILSLPHDEIREKEKTLFLSFK
jgi:hypothetical protein